MRIKKSLFLLIAIAMACSFAAAQVPTGRFVGKIVDDQGSPLPGVAVVATSPKLIGSASSVSDETGTYRIFSLPSGTYTLTFTLQGFNVYKREAVILQLEQTITLNVTLGASALEEQVTVIGQSPLIDVKSTTKSSVMTKEVFMKLPRNRDFNGLLSTVPGVQYEGVTGGLSVDGASGGENMFYIDGTNVNNIHLGGQAQSMVMEQVDEVKVTASGYTAEFGGSMGGVVSVISRSGSNQLHGDLYGYYNNNETWMQGKARTYLRTDPYGSYPYDYTEYAYVNNDAVFTNLIHMKRDPYQRIEGVLNLSGYIIKDKLWFFTSFNPTYSRQDFTRWFGTDPVNLAEADVPGNVILDRRQGRPLYPSFYTNRYYLYGNAKLTMQPAKKMRVSLSYVNNHSFYNGDSVPSVYGTTNKNQAFNADWETTSLLAGTTPGFAYPNWSANATADYTVSNNLLVSLRGGFMHQNTNNQKQVPPGTRWAFGSSNVGYSDVPTSLQHFNAWYNYPTANRAATKKWIQDRASVNLDLTYYLNAAGEHAFKFGGQYIRNMEDVDNSWLYPQVTLYWGDTQSYTMPSGAVAHGAYGYYTVINDFNSPYGANWKINSNAFAFYLQDSWTISDRLTLNLGLRTESEYIPALSPDLGWEGYNAKPISFGFGEKLAPRLGAIYDVFGDSSLKVFASYGIYYDVMKIYMAEGAYGGRKWQTSYYDLDNYNWDLIAANGVVSDAANQALGGDYKGSRNWRSTSFGNGTDPSAKPVSQSEFSFGAEKKLSEDISVSSRVVYKHLIRTIEDVGYLNADGDEEYIISNPGFGLARPVSQGGIFSDTYWPCPKAKREYWGINLSMEKRFSHNWQGGVNYTWSATSGNYGGLWSSDENGRQGPNVDRYFDLWFERFDLSGNPLSGFLPSDRSHYFKIFGSYSFPFGVTVGTVAYGRSGTPRTTMFPINDVTAVPNGYGDLGRLPFLFTADLYAEYTLKLGKRYAVQLNATVYNFTNTQTITGYSDTIFQNNSTIYLDYDILVQQGTPTGYTLWQSMMLANGSPAPVTNVNYAKWTGRYGAWSMRFGARFQF